MIEVICEAISKQRQLRLHYEPGSRVIEPHALGRGSDRQLLLRAFQVSGASASGEHHEWKLFRLDRCQDLEMLVDSFDGPRAGYRSGDRHMKGGIIQEL